MKQENIKNLIASGENRYTEKEIEKYNYCVFITTEAFSEEEQLKVINKEEHYFIILCNNKKEMETIKKRAAKDRDLKDHIVACYDLDKDNIILDTNKYKYTLKKVEYMRTYGFYR